MATRNDLAAARRLRDFGDLLPSAAHQELEPPAEDPLETFANLATIVLVLAVLGGGLYILGSVIDFMARAGVA